MFESVGRYEDLETRRTHRFAVLATAGIGLAIFTLTVAVSPGSDATDLQTGPEVAIAQWPEERAILLESEGPPQPPARGGSPDTGSFQPEANPEPSRPTFTEPTATGMAHQVSEIGTGGPPALGTGGAGESIPRPGDCRAGPCASTVDGPVRVRHDALRLIRGGDPSFPRHAIHLAGTRCEADLWIDRIGKVYRVAIIEPCPILFHRPIRDALRQWRFASPTTQTGQSTEARTRVAVRFDR